MEGNDAIAGGPSLPLWSSVPVAVLMAVVIFYQLLRTRNSAERYLLFACFVRYLVSAFHDYTYRTAAGGLSWIALSSIGLVGLGLLVLDKRRLFIWPFLPVAIVCVLMLISAFINASPAGAMEPIVRNIFFVVVAVAFWQAIDRGGARAITRLLWVFLLPLVFQILSIVLGVVKAGESDGSASYIGGYYHEQLFSLILASCFVVTCFATRIRRWLKVGVGLASLVGIALANYRTTIVGMAPLVVVQLFTGIPAAVLPDQRRFVRSALLMFAIVGLLAVGTVERDRFAGLAIAASQGTSLIKPPETFTPDDRRVLSGRPYIWSTYIYAYEKGTPAQKIVGFGPDSWTTLFRFYAHNTLVSYLFDLGLFGVAAILLWWATMLAVALRVPRELRPQVLAAHASFFLLNMATMPHWQIEGNILYGLICGYTLAHARARRRASDARLERLNGTGELPDSAVSIPVPAQ